MPSPKLNLSSITKKAKTNRINLKYQSTVSNITQYVKLDSKMQGKF